MLTVTALAALCVSPAGAQSANDVLLEIDRATRLARATREAEMTTPGTLSGTLDIARALREQFRITHDPRLLGQAEARLAPWLDKPVESVELLILQADLLQASHRFEAARTELQRAARLDPADTRIWTLLAAVELVSGRHVAARNACARLLGLARPLIAAGCAAQVAGVSGNAAAAYATLDATRQRERGESAAIQSWAESILAEQAWRLNRPDDAAQHFERALVLDPDNLTLRNDFALFLVLTGDSQGALALTGDLPALALPHAMALSQIADRPQHPPSIDQLRFQFETARRRGDNGHAREAAFFELFVERNASRALEQAQLNWKQQREPIDLWLLATAAQAAGDGSVLSVVNAWLSDTGLEDSRIGVPPVDPS